MEAIQDAFDELETVYDNVSKNAKDHIHSEYAFFVLSAAYVDLLRSEIILTLGASRTLPHIIENTLSLWRKQRHHLSTPVNYKLGSNNLFPDLADAILQHCYPQPVYPLSSFPIPQYTPSCHE